MEPWVSAGFSCGYSCSSLLRDVLIEKLIAKALLFISLDSFVPTELLPGMGVVFKGFHPLLEYELPTAVFNSE